MEVQAKQRYILMSQRKIRRIINLVRGKEVVEAYQILRRLPHRGARIVLKKLIEATSNARVKFGANPPDLIISKIFADEGPAYRRFKPRAQGRIYRREKPTAHLTVCVKTKKQQEAS